jgi:hypothetical protein
VLYGRAVAILEARWSDVEAVAAALVAEGGLDRQRLLALTDGLPNGQRTGVT